jgi:hypothetical protein
MSKNNNRLSDHICIWAKYYLIIQKLPGDLEMAFTTTISSWPIFDEGRRHIANPNEKISKSSSPNKWMET